MLDDAASIKQRNEPSSLSIWVLYKSNFIQRRVKGTKSVTSISFTAVERQLSMTKRGRNWVITKLLNRLPSTMKINFSQNESIAIDKQQWKGEVTWWKERQTVFTEKSTGCFSFNNSNQIAQISFLTTTFTLLIYTEVWQVYTFDTSTISLFEIILYNERGRNGVDALWDRGKFPIFISVMCRENGQKDWISQTTESNHTYELNSLMFHFNRLQ